MIGATGNVGSSVVAALSHDARVESVVAVARRMPGIHLPKVEWRAVDIRRDQLEPIFTGADAVVHLAWLIQPSKKPAVLASVNVHGSRRVFEAAAAAGVGALVHASSVGVYSAATGPEPVGESWPSHGIPTCSYSRDKASAERILDGVEAEHPNLRVVRLRPGLVLKRSAGAEVTRYFLGLDSTLAGAVTAAAGAAAARSGAAGGALPRCRIRVRGRGQERRRPRCVQRRRRTADHRGCGAGAIPGPRGVGAAGGDAGRDSAAWHAGLQPTDPGWLDMAMQSPVMDCTRARDELGWTPQHSSLEALADVLGGVRDQTSLATPVLR